MDLLCLSLPRDAAGCACHRIPASGTVPASEQALYKYLWDKWEEQEPRGRAEGRGLRSGIPGPWELNDPLLPDTAIVESETCLPPTLLQHRPGLVLSPLRAADISLSLPYLHSSCPSTQRPRSPPCKGSQIWYFLSALPIPRVAGFLMSLYCFCYFTRFQ